MSNFWERVDEELEYKGMNRKALATEVGFNLGNIGKGIQLGSSPSADTAVKIAKVLNVSVEYLVTGENPSLKNEGVDIKKYREYSALISQLDSLPENQKDLVKSIITKMCEWENKPLKIYTVNKM